jgi:hypothetical protein
MYDDGHLIVRRFTVHCSFLPTGTRHQKYNFQTPVLELRFGWLERKRRRTEEKQKHDFPFSSALNYALSVGVFIKVLT